MKQDKIDSSMKTGVLRGHAALLAANLLWGLMSPIAKMALTSGYLDAISLITFRILGAAILFWFASLFAKKEHVPHQDMIRLFFAALIGIVLNQGCYVFGVSMTSPIDVSIVATTAPIIAMIIAAFYLKEPVTAKKVLGVFLGATGALLLIISSARSETHELSGENHVLGALFCLLSQTFFALYFVVFKDLTARYSPLTLMKWMFIYSAICTIPFSYRSIIAIDFATMPAEVMIDILYVVVIGTFVTFMLLPVGQRLLRPTVGVMYNYIQPITASLVAVWWGIDTFGWMKGMAIGLVFLGVYVVTQSKSRAQMEAEKKALEEGTKNMNTNKMTEK